MSSSRRPGLEQVTVRELPDGRLSLADATRYLGDTAATLANMRSLSRGPRSVKVGGRRYFYLRDLDALIRGRKTRSGNGRDGGRSTGRPGTRRADARTGGRRCRTAPHPRGATLLRLTAPHARRATLLRLTAPHPRGATLLRLTAPHPRGATLLRLTAPHPRGATLLRGAAPKGRAVGAERMRRYRRRCRAGVRIVPVPVAPATIDELVWTRLLSPADVDNAEPVAGALKPSVAHHGSTDTWDPAPCCPQSSHVALDASPASTRDETSSHAETRARPRIKARSSDGRSVDERDQPSVRRRAHARSFSLPLPAAAAALSSSSGLNSRRLQ